jgi:hypothetical protein
MVEVQGVLSYRKLGQPAAGIEGHEEIIVEMEMRDEGFLISG